MATDAQNRAYLLKTAKLITSQLRLQTRGMRVRIAIPPNVDATNTDGWCIKIGSLGKDQPRLEIWFDRFVKTIDRKLYACFRCKDAMQITILTKRVSKKLWGVNLIRSGDIAEDSHVALVKKLARNKFNVPMLEKYENGYSRYGIYDPNNTEVSKANGIFAARAVAFFVDVISALHNADEDGQREIYPSNENRKIVSSHVRRERSRLLAAECKIRDKYICQICKFRFQTVYGNLGSQFAEAHHIVPLSKLSDKTLTNLQDLVTVCSNCHRMLHRMDGKASDITALKTVIRTNHDRG